MEGSGEEGSALRPLLPLLLPLLLLVVVVVVVVVAVVAVVVAVAVAEGTGTGWGMNNVRAAGVVVSWSAFRAERGSCEPSSPFLRRLAGSVDPLQCRYEEGGSVGSLRLLWACLAADAWPDVRFFMADYVCTYVRVRWMQVDINRPMGGRLVRRRKKIK